MKSYRDCYIHVIYKVLAGVIALFELVIEGAKKLIEAYSFLKNKSGFIYLGATYELWVILLAGIVFYKRINKCVERMLAPNRDYIFLFITVVLIIIFVLLANSLFEFVIRVFTRENFCQLSKIQNRTNEYILIVISLAALYVAASDLKKETNYLLFALGCLFFLSDVSCMVYRRIYGDSVKSIVERMDSRTEKWTRLYAEKKEEKKCRWREKLGKDVTVVLTLYKRPETLKLQIDAINNQTIKPKLVLLFQDKVKEGNPIIIPDADLKSVDDYYIAEENKGVWGRFAYARENCQTKYVCVLDDDTIPGPRWIETCIGYMEKKKAIYATLGIRLTKRGGYPYKDYYRIGWCSENNKCEEVDFAGHGWFFDRECLDWMFEGTESIRALKTAGEDMGLSFSAQRHGVPTIITPHPSSDRSIWGSMPDEAIYYGTSTEATGINGNYPNMNKAIKTYEDMGWSYCVDRKRFYVIAYIKLRDFLQKIRGVSKG